MTATIVAPTAMHFLLAQGVGAGKTLCANVLAGSYSQLPKDPTSVVLLGLIDIGRDNTADSAYVQDGGKVMNVPGEGTWLVDNSGLVVFQADASFDDPPTPVSFQFSDSKGNQSNPAMILFDPALAELTPFLKALANQSDKDFWKSFRKGAIEDLKPLTLDLDELLNVTQTYALAVRRLVPSELISPVSDAEYQVAYQKWVQQGSINAELIDICTALAEKANHANPKLLSTRYWGLTLMVQMLVDFLRN